MHNIIVKKYGQPSDLYYEKLEEQKLGKNDVRIKVDYAGINFADILTIKGKYQERPRPPFTPGLEVSGKVIEVGELSKRIKVGDNVMAIMKFGGYKQIVVVPEENTYKVPKKMSLKIAGGFPVVYGTAFSALVEKGNIKKNDVCMILGATGGVGIAAIEIAKAYGAKVIACGGDNKKLEICLKHGANYIVNYKEDIVRTKLKKMGFNEINLVIDMIGGQSTLDAVKTLSWNGRLVIVGFASGTIPNIPANRLLLKNAKVEGLYWGEYAYRNPLQIEKDFLILEKLYLKNKIKPLIYKEFNLKDASSALSYLKQRKNAGKIILNCQS